MLPLTGRRILVTRTRHQASELAARLEAFGATPILIPTIELAPPPSFAVLDHAILHLADHDWLLFTSANAVEAFHQRSTVHGLLPPIPTAAIGPATARAAASIGLNVILTPPQAVAESFAKSLLPHILPGSRLLLVRAVDARNHLPDTLTAAGAHVTIAEAYCTQIPAGSMLALRELFASSIRYPDAVTFTSSSTVTNLLAILRAGDLTLPPEVLRASIGPITSRTLWDCNLPSHLESTEASIPALAQALVDHFVR